jgi:hypothetical protein
MPSLFQKREKIRLISKYKRNYSPISLEKPYIRFIAHNGVVIGMAIKISTASSPTSTMTLQSTFSKAILCLIYGRPELEEVALKKVEEIIDFAMKYKSLRESASDDSHVLPIQIGED